MPPLTALAFALVAATLGGMTFFAGAVAPTIFRVLPQVEAGRFLRALFRHYYLAFGVASALAALAAGVGGRGREALLLALVAAGFAVARQGLMPRINALRDRALAGETGVEPSFNALHRTSVWLNTFQMIGLVLIAVLLVS